MVNHLQYSEFQIDDRVIYPPSIQIVDATADFLAVSLIDMPVLYNCVDVDSLDGLVRGSQCLSLLKFEYAGCEITVHGGGRVRITDRNPKSD